MRRHHAAVGARDLEAHRGRIFVAEIEDVPDLDPAAGAAAVFGDLGPARLVMGLVGRRIGRADLLEQAAAGPPRRHNRGSAALPVELLERGVVKDFALAGRGEDDEFVAEVAADRPRRGLHRHRLDAHPLEGAQISEQLRVIAVAARRPRRGRSCRRPSSGTRARASRRSAGGPRRGTSTGCGRACAAGRGSF